MGSFYMKCGITNTTITDGSDIYGFVLIEKKGRGGGKNLYVDDSYDILPIPIKGTYGDYGQLLTDKKQHEFLDWKMKMFDKDFTIKHGDNEYSLSNISELYENLGYHCHNENQHQFHYLLAVIERDEDVKIIPKMGMFDKVEYSLSMLMVNGRFIKKLLDNYRVDPYIKEMSEESKEHIRKYGFSVFDRYSQLDSLYLDLADQETKVYKFLKRYIFSTQTPIMPSNYGGQDVDLASLRLMSEFCEEEIDYLHKDMYGYLDEDSDEYRKKEEVVKIGMGGTHWFEIGEGGGYKQF